MITLVSRALDDVTCPACAGPVEERPRTRIAQAHLACTRCDRRFLPRPATGSRYIIADPIIRTSLYRSPSRRKAPPR